MLGYDQNLPFSFRSEEFKDFKRRTDGLLDYPGSDIAYIVEFQAQYSSDVYHRGEMCRIEYDLKANRGKPRNVQRKKVCLILIFMTPGADPKSEPWWTLADKDHPLYKVYYFEELLRELAKREPNNPLLIVCKPFITKDRQKLAQDAKNDYLKLKKVTINMPDHNELIRVFEFWLFSNFKHLNKKELSKMLPDLGDITESVAYQEILEEGRHEGLTQGLTKGEVIYEILVLQAQKGLPVSTFRTLYQLDIDTLNSQLAALRG